MSLDLFSETFVSFDGPEQPTQLERCPERPPWWCPQRVVDVDTGQWYVISSVEPQKTFSELGTKESLVGDSINDGALVVLETIDDDDRSREEWQPSLVSLSDHEDVVVTDGSFQSMSILKESMNGSVPRLDSDIAVDDDRSPREKTKDLLETVTDRLASHESGLVTDSFGDRDRRQVFGSVVHGQVDCSSQKRFDLSILDIRVVDEPDHRWVYSVDRSGSPISTSNQSEKMLVILAPYPFLPATRRSFSL